jgi:hypothetical protein
MRNLDSRVEEALPIIHKIMSELEKPVVEDEAEDIKTKPKYHIYQHLDHARDVLRNNSYRDSDEYEFHDHGTAIDELIKNKVPGSDTLAQMRQHVPNVDDSEEERNRDLRKMVEIAKDYLINQKNVDDSAMDKPEDSENYKPTQETQVNELEPGDEPIDAPIEPPVDHGGIVTSFLTDPDNKLVLRKDASADKLLTVTKFKDKNTMLSSIMSDIAERMLTKSGEEDRIANFASRVADGLDQEKSAAFKPTPDYIKNKKIAIQLAKRYIDDYKKMQKDPGFADEIRMDPADYNPKKDIKGKAKETEQFESWVENIDQVEEDKGSTLASRMIRKAGMDDPESMDAEVFKKSADLLDAGDLDEFGKYIYKQDTAPREFVMKKLADHDPETFKKVYGDQEGYLATMKPMSVSKADKDLNTPAFQKMKAGDKRYTDKTENQLEGLTFEDIKPYVSMYKGDDGKTVNAVLDKDGKEVFKTGDAKTAMQYLAKNFDKLKNPVKESNPELDRIKSLSFYQ